MNITDYIESGVIETVIMGLAEPQEVAELERLRREYPEVEAYAMQCEQWLLDTAMKNAVPVPAAARENFLQQITASSGANESTTATTLPANPSGKVRKMNSLRYAAAASIILLIGSAVLNFYLYSEYAKARQAYTDLNNINVNLASQNKQYEAQLIAMNQNAEIITSPEYAKIPLAGIEGKEAFAATVFWNKKTAAVYLLANNLPAAPAGKQYQLWALVDGKPVDAGMLQDCKELLCTGKNIGQAQAFAITLEKLGGSPQPDLSQLYVLGKITT